MSRMRLSRLAGGFLLLAACRAAADDLVWHGDLAEAQAQARREHKSVLLVFSGSAWCPPCIEMRTAGFSIAGVYCVRAPVSCPGGRGVSGNRGADPSATQPNSALKSKFNVGDNLPTLVLLNEAGDTVFQEAGYSGGGPAEVLRSLQRHAAPPSSAAAQSGFHNVNVDDFAKMAADPQNVILDVRTPKEFESGHLSGALNLDFNAPDFLDRIKALDRSKTYLVHCASGVRSARACTKLSQLDFPRLYNLKGGIHAWIKAGQPVIK